MTQRTRIAAIAGFIFANAALITGFTIYLRPEQKPDETPWQFAGRTDDVRNILRDFDLSYRPMSEFMAILSAEDLPIFFTCLTDPSSQDYRYRALLAIAYFGRGDDVARNLMDFIKRPESFQNDHDINGLYDKAYALEYLGIVGGPIAEEVLVQAVTEQGAWNLAAGWWNDVNPEILAHSTDFFLTMRYHAAFGLAYTGDPENGRIIEFMYADALSTARRVVAKYENETMGLSLCTPMERSILVFYEEMAWALAIRDTINAIGLDKYLPQLNNPKFKDGSLEKYRVLTIRYGSEETPTTPPLKVK